MQCIALLIVTAAGILVSVAETEASRCKAAQQVGGNTTLGLACIITASALSGFGGAASEWILQGKKRDSYLFSSEMAGLGVVMILFGLLLNLNGDGEVWRGEGLFARWTPGTLLPVLAQ